MIQEKNQNKQRVTSLFYFPDNFSDYSILQIQHNLFAPIFQFKSIILKLECLTINILYQQYSYSFFRVMVDLQFIFLDNLLNYFWITVGYQNVICLRIKWLNNKFRTLLGSLVINQLQCPKAAKQFIDYAESNYWNKYKANSDCIIFIKNIFYISYSECLANNNQLEVHPFSNASQRQLKRELHGFYLYYSQPLNHKSEIISQIK